MIFCSHFDTFLERKNSDHPKERLLKRLWLVTMCTFRQPPHLEKACVSNYPPSSIVEVSILLEAEFDRS